MVARSLNGASMLPAAIADLARSGLAPAQAEAAGMFDVESAKALRSEFRDLPAIVIPYFDASGAVATFGPAAEPFCRVRYLTDSASGFARKALRYAQPAHSGTRAYFAPLLDWRAILSDANEPVLVVEGEKKALAGVAAGLPVLGLGGVFNFATSGGELMPELSAAEWRGRDVYIVFDSDAVSNPNILAAEARLVAELQRKRGARCYLVRLPAGERKTGLDDYLLAHGREAFLELLQSAPALGALDAKVIALNKSCAWIERENLVYDLESRMFLPKDSFLCGSKFSAIEHITVGATQRAAPKRISVAKAWLTHPHAQRFREALFRPGEGPTVAAEHGGTALNMWTGWEPSDGDAAPFLELSEYLFSDLDPQHRDLPLKLIAYKAQNPAEKVPLAVVLIGQQGCGKTLWGECVRDAFAPYGVDVTPQALAGEFQGWLERSLIALINEAKGEDMTRASEQLKALISDLNRPMNEKYRPVRQIKTYTLYIITSNRRAVGAFSPDDRRMIVVDCPPKRDWEFYERVSQWKRNGGAAALLGWLLRYDLQGWKPPASAPMTAEKYMAYVESLSPVAQLAEEMRTADTNSIRRWLDQSTDWAAQAELSGNPALAATARDVRQSLAHWQIRPWYTAAELALMFPSLVHGLLGSSFSRSTPSGAISRELRECGVPYLRSRDDPRGFVWRGAVRQYLVVSDFEEWRAPLGQSDFERLMAAWPSYGSLRK